MQTSKLINFIFILFFVVLNASESQALEVEKENSGWAFYFDNDLFTLGDRDNDYTGGVALKLAGTRVQSYFLSVDSLLEKLNNVTGYSSLFSSKESFTTHSMEMGFTLFTPMDLETVLPVYNQHPYASLFFINNTQMVIIPESLLTYQSTFTVGVLGLKLAADLQHSIHKVLGAEVPRGWRNQISAGGEPTVKYSVSRSRNYNFNLSGINKLELKLSSEANIGYTTDVGISTSLRWGRIETPWWSFNSHNAEYISLGSPVVATSRKEQAESYLWFGVGLKYRFYNAMLQGQFRESKVIFDRDQLEPVIAELWLGYTHEFEAQWHLSAFIRKRNKEIDLAGLDNPFWGGFIISKSF